MEIVLFLYGLAFFVLGAVVLLHPKAESHYALAPLLWIFGGFALLHGVEEWFNLWEALRGTTANLESAQSLLLAISFVFLFEFGRQLFQSVQQSAEEPAHWPARLGASLHFPLASIVLIVTALSPEPWIGLRIAAKYTYGLLGGLLAGGAMWRYYRLERDTLGHLPVKLAFALAAVALVTYGLFTGLVVPPADFFPASALNSVVFERLTGIPVELPRAVCAIVATGAMMRILRVFDAERRQQLVSALGGVQRSLSEIRRISHRNELILASTADGIMEFDVNGRLTYANPSAVHQLAIEADDYLQQHFSDALPIRNVDNQPNDEADHPIARVLQEQAAVHSDDHLIERRDGTLFPASFNATPVTDEGELMGAVIAFADISQRKQAEKNLRLASRVIDATAEAITITDARGNIVSVNPAFTRVMGYRPEEVVGRTAHIVRSGYESPDFYERMRTELASEGHWQGEIWMRRKSGDIFPEWLNISVIRDEAGQVTNYVGIYSDINTQEQMQQRLHFLAYYDALTSLPNRQLFNDHLGLALVQARRSGRQVGVMFLDLDRFKNINDTLGHSTGDAVLKATAERVKGCVRKGDTVARLGGDEFIVILPELEDPRYAAVVARKILRTMRRPLQVDEREFHLTTSIGIALFPEDGEDIETLTKNADTAMYRAKELGRNNSQFYADHMSARFQERVALEQDLRRALERDELFLLYQPQTDLRKGEVVGVEALLRWNHPQRGVLTPETFIPVAEDSGLVDRLGHWVLSQACRQASRWRMNGSPALRLAVNMSAHELTQPHLVKRLQRILHEAQLPGDALELEMTETALTVNAAATQETLRALNQLGIQLAIDDFGTGYSSLSYLKQFAIDKLKIDHSFVHDMTTNPNDSAIATTIIAMAHAMELRVIAEGVETEEQLEFLRRNGCDEIQGFIYSDPLPAEKIDRLFAHSAHA